MVWPEHGRVNINVFGGRLVLHEGLHHLVETNNVVDVSDASRLPDPEMRRTIIEGISLPRLAVASGAAPLPAVISLLNSPADGWR